MRSNGDCGISVGSNAGASVVEAVGGAACGAAVAGGTVSFWGLEPPELGLEPPELRVTLGSQHLLFTIGSPSSRAP